MLNRLVRYLVKAVAAEMRVEGQETPGAVAEMFVVSRYPKGPNDVYVEWRLWEETPDEAEAGPAVGWYKRTRQPSAPYYGQLLAGLVGKGEGIPVASVQFVYQHYGPKEAYVAELGVGDGTHHYIPFPTAVRQALVEAGWKELMADSRRVKAPDQVVSARLYS